MDIWTKLIFGAIAYVLGRGAYRKYVAPQPEPAPQRDPDAEAEEQLERELVAMQQELNLTPEAVERLREQRQQAERQQAAERKSQRTM
ncbi:MAG: hypothetical protein ABIG71_01885 [Candidatus Uhrbacteria bacterium]